VNDVTDGDGGLPPSTKEVIEEWARVAGKATDRHAAACDYFERLNSQLGVTTTALAAIVGSTVFVGLQQTTSPWIKAAEGTLGLAAAVLAGIQTTMKFGARSEQYRQASRHYGALARQIDEFLALPPSPADLPEKFDTLRKSFDDAGAAAPDVPPRIWNQKPRRQGSNVTAAHTSTTSRPAD